MTANRGLFVKQVGTAPTAVGTTPQEARLALAGLVFHDSAGVPRSGVLDPQSHTLVGGTGTMSYNVFGHHPVIRRATDDGVYMPTFTGTTAVATDPAPGSGSRYDLIWVKQNDTDKGDPDNLAYAGVTVGISGTTPGKPTASVPEGALVLAEALVQTLAPSTNSGLVTITQVFPYTTTRGGILTVRDGTDRATITPGEGTQVRRRDLFSTIETYRNGAWQATTPTLIPSGNLYAGWSRAATSGGLAPKLWSPDGVTVHMSGGVQFGAGAGGNILTVPAPFIPTSSSLTYIGAVQASNGSANPAGGPSIELFLENGIIRIGYQSGSVALNSFVPLHGIWTIR